MALSTEPASVRIPTVKLNHPLSLARYFLSELRLLKNMAMACKSTFTRKFVDLFFCTAPPGVWFCAATCCCMTVLLSGSI
jgi:hypothetical protein